MDGIYLPSDDLRIGDFLLRIYNNQSDSLQHHVKQVSNGVYGKCERNIVTQRRMIKLYL